VSTPQPIPEGEQNVLNHGSLDMRHLRPHAFEHDPSNLSNSLAPQYMYNVNGGSLFTAVKNASQPFLYVSPGLFIMQ
jgi:GATA-binding protein